ncbi:unnamed protein product, partial [Medioppia subpectinata]
ETTAAPLNVLHSRCPHCGRIFRGQRSSFSLQEHINSIHAVVVPSSKSNMASSPSASHSSDAMVGRTQDDKSFVCSQCKASFAQKDELEKHELIHSSQGQYCLQCNKSFANVYRLQRHMLSHDESQVLRKFKCPECFKAFKFKHHLKEHIRIHSGEKPFACPNCAKRFSHSGSYSSHMTSKKCLVVNLKVRKVDQIRGQRNRSNHLTTNGVTANGVSPPMTKLDLLANISDTQTNLKMSSNNMNYKKDFDITSNRNHSVLKTESNDNFAPLYLNSDLNRCLPESPSFANYLPTNYSPGVMPSLHPVLFSAAAASVGLPTHYLSTAISSYPEVANAILRSQMNKTVAKELELNRDKYSNNYNNNKKLDLTKLSDKSLLENYDLNSVKKILQIVDSTVDTKSRPESMNGSYGEMRSPNPSPLTLSMSSLPLPQITPIDSPDDLKKSLSNSLMYLRCRYCNEYFENKIDLYQHESHVCKSRVSLNDKSLNEFNKDINCNNISNTINSSAAESDDESQRDSSSLEEEVMTTDGKKVRVRSVLGEQTLRVLRTQYEANPRPKKHDILRLAQEVNYSPRVVQVWFQNMRARDRRLGKPITASHMSSELNSNDFKAQRVMTSFSPSLHSTHHSIANPLMPISIPHYKPASNKSDSMSFSPTITSFAPDINDINGLSHYGQRIHNNAVYYLNSNELSMNSSMKSNLNKSFSSRSDSLTDEPLDLSVRSKSMAEDFAANSESEEKYHSIEVLNLSQKSSRSHDTSDDEMPNNVSLTLIQQHQQKELQELEQTSIVRSMLKSKCHSQELDMNLMNGTAMQSTDRMTRTSPTVSHDSKETPTSRQSFKRSHSDCEDIESQSDCNNPSDDYMSTNSITRSKHTITSPSKLWKGTTDNVINSDDQSPPPDANSQADGMGLFTCDQCDKTFSKQSSLARHKYEHSGQRPHKCDVCNKAFKHKHHLTEHKRLHSGEKPFQCKKCLKRFSHSGSYSQHMNHRYSYCKPYRD